VYDHMPVSQPRRLISTLVRGLVIANHVSALGWGSTNVVLKVLSYRMMYSHTRYDTSSFSLLASLARS